MKLLLVCVLSVLGFSGCLEEDESHYFNGFKYWILISDKFSPELSTLKVGEIIDEGESLMGLQMEKFGTIKVNWDGKQEAVFDKKGSIGLTRNKGGLHLTGKLNKTINIVILESQSSTKLRIKTIQKIDPGELNSAFKLK